jgi:hypothetical protein
MMMMMMTQEIPKISSKFLRPVKARSLGGDDRVPSMFARSLTIGKVEEDGQQQQQQQQDQDQQPSPSSRPSSSNRRVAAATPLSHLGGKLDQDERLFLLQETVRSRIARASPQPLPSADARSTPYTAASHSTAYSLDGADELILKLHLSTSTNARAKALRDLSGNFFPKALEVTATCCRRFCVN